MKKKKKHKQQSKQKQEHKRIQKPIDITEKTNVKIEEKCSLSPVKKTIVGAQFLFVAFGSTVLVPLLVGLDPSVALFTAGIGTLIFHLITKGKVPIFLGSSFAFIAPIIRATELYGLAGTLCGLVSVGAVYELTFGIELNVFSPSKDCAPSIIKP